MANEQELLDMHVTVIQPDLEGKLITRNAHLSSQSATEILAKLKAMGYEQVWEKCPDCEGERDIYWCEEDVECGKVCPTCKGTGKVTKYEYVKWDRELVARYFWKKWKQYCGRDWDSLSDKIKDDWLLWVDQLKEILNKEGNNE